MRFRVDSPTGPIVGDLSLASTGGWNNYVTIPANAGGVTGVHTLYVTFESGYYGDYVNVDRLQFGQRGQAVPNLADAPTVGIAASLAAAAAPATQSARQKPCVKAKKASKASTKKLQSAASKKCSPRR